MQDIDQAYVSGHITETERKAIVRQRLGLPPTEDPIEKAYRDACRAHEAAEAAYNEAVKARNAAWKRVEETSEAHTETGAAVYHATQALLKAKK